jgi:uncharacterized membrane protein
MSEADQEVIPPGGGPQDGDDSERSPRDFAGIAYILYLIGLVNGLTALVGVIMIHLKSGAVPEGSWLRSHYTWLARTFWTALLAGVAGIVLVLISFGILLIPVKVIFFPLLWLWYAWRVVKGGLRFMDRKPVENPEGWV